MKVLVIGRSGQVARALRRRAAARGIELGELGRPDLDLLEPDAAVIESAARGADAIINAAAYTAVDKAEDEPDQAGRINGAAPGVIARAAASSGARLAHISTDYVFTGDKSSPYIESDPTGPTGVYGVTKLEGERNALAANANTVILRTAWVFDGSGANFVRTMLRLAKARDELGVVADQFGCPTFADDLADAALTVAAARDHTGIYHCAGAGETNWAGFAEEIFAQSRARGGPSARVRPITTAEFPTRARRPANSRLDCSKLVADCGVRMRPWREALASAMDEIAAGGWRVE